MTTTISVLRTLALAVLLSVALLYGSFIEPVKMTADVYDRGAGDPRGAPQSNKSASIETSANTTPFVKTDLIHPFDRSLQTRAVDSFIRSLGATPYGYERLPISNERINKMFQDALHVKALRGDPTGDANPRRQAIRAQQRSNESIVAGLARILLRAPTDEVLDYFVKRAMTLDFGGANQTMEPVLWIGEPEGTFGGFLYVYYSEPVRLLANSKAIDRGMLLASLARIDSFVQRCDRIAVAHALFQRFKRTGLSDDELDALLDVNFGQDSASNALLHVIDDMRAIATGNYEYMSREQALKRAVKEGFLVKP